MRVQDLRIGNWINDRCLDVEINPSIMVNILLALSLFTNYKILFII